MCQASLVRGDRERLGIPLRIDPACPPDTFYLLDPRFIHVSQVEPLRGWRRWLRWVLARLGSSEARAGEDLERLVGLGSRN